ncbi:16S rRNA (cytidine(1402)-2'-O)-methyltransferase [Leucobacter sp. UCMA 4100]|uniref:16S rRNA (cytidine(1402)-2'-O)-methyltransferase n=1 Tax=Leucobacter sp. UCMA 4100 TaxID=2810534 RepID=UPI0022EA6308|nr:16S rRNA (cytidine(1402)-2'-O)-methyltransferase [Leucobacter sp. UCMA 4100]MDA3147762.1 16S rRNA (cytidine(1402)-2'-O)-methyltransferase [Leucobacter sp. UCMA 4100]
MIILAATPIGNLGDASARLREVFEGATVIACEDTRHTANLLRLLEIENRPELLALHDHNERERAAGLVERARHEDLVVVSDAGMPTVSDPGYRLVQEAVQQGVDVTVIPGPSAVTTALALSGLPTDRFSFEGFAPRKHEEQARTYSALAEERRTMVFFEAPQRVEATLRAMAEAMGAERRAAVCRELTKLYEEVQRGTLTELADWAAEGVRGEVVIVVAGGEPAVFSLSDGLGLVRDRVAAGVRLKDATKQVAQETGLVARELYEQALAEKG